MKSGRHTETFLVKIRSKQNSTWQGSVTWVEEQQEQNFRNVLELLKLMDEVIDNNVEIEGGGYEK